MLSLNRAVFSQTAPLAAAIACWLVAGCITVTHPSPAAADDRAEPGPYTVDEVLGEWKDSARKDRPLHWKAYLPKDAKSPAPVVLYSPGGGGNRESNAMLGRHLASHGFAAFHLQHQGSDDKAVRADRKVLKAINDPKASEDRFRDIAFAVKSLAVEAREGSLKGRLDPVRVGVAGHSYGALTAQIVAGQEVKGYGQKLAIPELRGAFILSPSPPRAAYGDERTAFSNMLMPMFHLTGTADRPPDLEFKAADRAVPFQKTSNVDQWLLVLKGASHFTMSGQERRPRIARLIPGMEDDPNLAQNHAFIRAAAVAFWQWTLLGDRAARRYLDDGAFRRFVGERGEFYLKSARR